MCGTIYTHLLGRLSLKDRIITLDYSSNNVSTSRCCAPTLLLADKWITKAVAKAVVSSSRGKIGELYSTP